MIVESERTGKKTFFSQILSATPKFQFYWKNPSEKSQKLSGNFHKPEVLWWGKTCWLERKKKERSFILSEFVFFKSFRSFGGRGIGFSRKSTIIPRIPRLNTWKLEAITRQSKSTLLLSRDKFIVEKELQDIFWVNSSTMNAKLLLPFKISWICLKNLLPESTSLILLPS